MKVKGRLQEYRPWGKYEILHEEKNCKVKKLRLSLVAGLVINIIIKEVKYGR